MKNNDELPRRGRAVARAIRRHQARQAGEQLRLLEAFHGACADVGATLARDALWDVCGARAALLPPVLCLMARVEDCVAAWESMQRVATAPVASVAQLQATGAEMISAHASVRRHRDRLLIAVWALRDAVLTWRLRAEQWRANWPTKRDGELVRLPDPAAGEQWPKWMSPARAAMFWSARTRLYALQRHRSTCTREAECFFDATATGLPQHSALRIEHFSQTTAALDATFRTLIVLRDADVPDELLSQLCPKDLPL